MICNGKKSQVCGRSLLPGCMVRNDQHEDRRTYVGLFRPISATPRLLGDLLMR